MYTCLFDEIQFAFIRRRMAYIVSVRRKTHQSINQARNKILCLMESRTNRRTHFIIGLSFAVILLITCTVVSLSESND